MTIGLLARVNGGIAAKEIKRLLANPEGAAVADGANGAGAGQPRDNALDRRIHFGGRRDLVADQAAVGAIAGQSALIKNGLTRNAIAGEPRQAQIGEAWNDSFLAGRQGDESVGRGENVVHDEKRLAMAADGECVDRGDPQFFNPAAVHVVGHAVRRGEPTQKLVHVAEVADQEP